MTDQDLMPHPQAAPPIDGELREFGTNAGALWQYTRIDGCCAIYGYGVTP